MIDLICRTQAKKKVESKQKLKKRKKEKGKKFQKFRGEEKGRIKMCIWTSFQPLISATTEIETTKAGKRQSKREVSLFLRLIGKISANKERFKWKKKKKGFTSKIQIREREGL